MTKPREHRIGPVAILAAFLALTPGVWAQSGHYTSQSVVLGTGGYGLNFGVIWTCDDSPRGTVSAPGEVDLVDGNGKIVASVLATASGTTPQISVSGAGTISGANASINLTGADGTPADGLLHATWNITGPAAGSYTLRFWLPQRKVSRAS